MSKIKFTKGELKRQRDALSRYERYLPTLQLKKQQLQLEILHQSIILEEKGHQQDKKKKEIEAWAGLLTDTDIEVKQSIKPKDIIVKEKNIAGVNLPVFERVEFPVIEYDLFTTPLWVDRAIEEFQKLISLREEIKVIKTAIAILRQELRITTQRVNLFEKVKIPQTKEAIRLIKIYLGDQMTNAVGRSKIAKKKIQALQMEGSLI